MTRSGFRVMLGAICLVAPLPVSAQDASDRDAEIEALRSELKAARAHIETLENRLETLSETDADPQPGEADGAVQMSVGADRVPQVVEPAQYNLPRPDLASAGTGSSPATGGTIATVGLVAGKDSSRASVTLSRSAFRALPAGCILQPGEIIDPDEPCNDTGARYAQDVTALSLSAPLAKSGDTSFATLDGLATGTKAEVRFTRFLGRVPPAEAVFDSAPVVAARTRCAAQNGGSYDTCIRIDEAFLSRYMTSAERAAYDRFVFDRVVRDSLGLTVAGSLGYEEFTFFPAPALAKDEVERLSYGIKAGALYFPTMDSSFIFETEYQRSWKAASSVTRCPTDPGDGDSFLTCATGAPTTPREQEKLILSPQFRRLIPLGQSGLIRSLGFAPKFEFDVLSDDFAFDLPVYLVTSKKDGLVAGIRFGLESEDGNEDVKFGVFYGQSFDLRSF